MLPIIMMLLLLKHDVGASMSGAKKLSKEMLADPDAVLETHRTELRSRILNQTVSELEDDTTNTSLIGRDAIVSVLSMMSSDTNNVCPSDNSASRSSICTGVTSAEYHHTDILRPGWSCLTPTYRFRTKRVYTCNSLCQFSSGYECYRGQPQETTCQGNATVYADDAGCSIRFPDYTLCQCGVYDASCVDVDCGPGYCSGSTCICPAGRTGPNCASANCVGTWGDFGVCSATCAGGTQARTYRVISPALGEGNSCPYNQDDVETKICVINVECGPLPYEVTKYGVIPGGIWIPTTEAYSLMVQNPPPNITQCPDGYPYPYKNGKRCCSTRQTRRGTYLNYDSWSCFEENSTMCPQEPCGDPDVDLSAKSAGFCPAGTIPYGWGSRCCTGTLNKSRKKLRYSMTTCHGFSLICPWGDGKYSCADTRMADSLVVLGQCPTKTFAYYNGSRCCKWETLVTQVDGVVERRPIVYADTECNLKDWFDCPWGRDAGDCADARIGEPVAKRCNEGNYPFDFGTKCCKWENATATDPVAYFGAECRWDDSYDCPHGSSQYSCEDPTFDDFVCPHAIVANVDEVDATEAKIQYTPPDGAECTPAPGEIFTVGKTAIECHHRLSNNVGYFDVHQDQKDRFLAADHVLRLPSNVMRKACNDDPKDITPVKNLYETRDRCKVQYLDFPVAVLSSNLSHVTFEVKQVWNTAGKLHSISVDHLSPELGRICPKKTQISPGPFAEYQALCDEGYAEVHLYMHDPSLSQTDGNNISSIVPQRCNLEPDAGKQSCHRLFRIPCCDRTSAVFQRWQLAKAEEDIRNAGLIEVSTNSGEGTGAAAGEGEDFGNLTEVELDSIPEDLVDGVCTFHCFLDQAGVRADPHFRGFDGSRYNFMGEPGVVWNIITDLDYQLNALFISAVKKERTYMGKLGFKIGSVEVTISLSEVTINGTKIKKDGVYNFFETEHKGHINFIKNDKIEVGGLASPLNGGLNVSVLAAGFQVHVTTVHKEGTDYLDIRTTTHGGDIFNPHGLLGQTARYLTDGTEPKPVKVPKWKKMAEGFIEGVPTDYIVADGILGTAFSFNRFGTGPFKGDKSRGHNRYAFGATAAVTKYSLDL